MLVQCIVKREKREDWRPAHATRLSKSCRSINKSFPFHNMSFDSKATRRIKFYCHIALIIVGWLTRYCCLIEPNRNFQSELSIWRRERENLNKSFTIYFRLSIPMAFAMETLETVKSALRDVIDFWGELTETLQVKTPEPAMDLLINKWLLCYYLFLLLLSKWLHHFLKDIF